MSIFILRGQKSYTPISVCCDYCMIIVFAMSLSGIFIRFVLSAIKSNGQAIKITSPLPAMGHKCKMMVDILTYCKHLKKLHIEFSCATTLRTAEIFLSEK